MANSAPALRIVALRITASVGLELDRSASRDVCPLIFSFSEQIVKLTLIVAARGVRQTFISR
jgi:hypothetical protein